MRDGGFAVDAPPNCRRGDARQCFGCGIRLPYTGEEYRNDVKPHAAPPTPMLIPDAAVSEVPTSCYLKARTASVTRVYPEPPGRWRRAGKKARCISVDNP